LFTCNPFTLGQPNDILCERCCAKIYYDAEYPNLSQQALKHIKSLPRVSSMQNFHKLPQFGGGFSAGLTPSLNSTQSTITTNPLLGNFPLIQNSSTCSNSVSETNDHQLRVPTFGTNDKVKFLQKQANEQAAFKKNLEIFQMPNSSQQFMLPTQNHTFHQTNIPNSINQENKSGHSNKSEKAKLLNEFIKKTLFPELMELPNLEPQTKSLKKDDAYETEEDEKEDRTEWPFEWIGDDVKSIRDLIRIGREYKTNPKRVQTNLDMEKLVCLVEPLETLQNMIGLEDIKDSIFKQVIFHLQDLDNGNKDMHHTVIKGPPGVGKTQISHIIARIYKGLGFLKKDTVVSVKRDDLIAGYLGQTAMKAKKKYEEALGGVLLIDEAYALGDGSDKDSYSKEAIDLLTSYLSEHGHEFICIIAGYKDALENRFFSVNEGLARRFNIHYEIKPYSGADICQIFQKLVSDGGWQLDASAYNPEFFVANLDAFPHFGGDMLNLFVYTKKAHSTRLLSIRTKEQFMNTKKKINMSDLEAGFEQYKAGNGYATKEQSFDAKFMYM